MSIVRHHTGPRMSQAVEYGTTVYLAGQVAANPDGDITQQTGEVLAAIDRLLAECGSAKAKILSATVFLASMGDYAAMNAVWEKWVDGANAPARATVEAKLAAPKYKVEVVVVAAK